MKKKIYHALVSCAVLMASPVCQAVDSYQYAIDGLYESDKSDAGVDETDLGVGVRYYFAPVNPGKGPLKLADFLSPQSSVVVIVTDVDLDFDIVSLSGTLFGFGYRYADPTQPYTFSAIYDTGEAKKSIIYPGDSSRTHLKITRDALSLELGYYLDPRRQIIAEVAQANYKSSATGANNESTKYESNIVSAKYRNVAELANLHYLDLVFGASVIENDDNDTNLAFAVDADYFVNLGMDFFGGVNLNTGDNDSAEGTTLNIGVGAFFNPNTAVRFELTQFLAKQSNNDSDSVLVNFEARF